MLGGTVRLVAWGVSIVSLAGVIVLLAIWRFGVLLDRPGPLEADAVIVVERGASLSTIATTLADTAVIDDPWRFAVAARLLSAATDLQAGEYAFAAGISLRDTIEKLRRGETLVRRLTVPEGLTSRQIVALVEQAPGLVGTVDAVPTEGSLLPDTYHYSRSDTRADLLAAMARAMETALADLWPTRQPDLPLNSPQEAVILASIVERETGLAEERARVAGVFVNRLRIGMRLQSDPTVIYGLTDGGGRLDRPLLRRDLQDQSPFNTYRIAGLPPTPIANPGRAAIAAVLQPMATDEFYFVADGTGGHAFARTLQEHNRNVAAWRRFQRAQENAQ